MKRFRITLFLLLLAGLMSAAQALPPGTGISCGPIDLVPDLASPRQGPPILTPQPDTLFYDSGTPLGLYTAANHWARVKFTAPYALELRSVYFVGNNPRNDARPCSLFVYAAAGNNLGALLGTYRLPTNVVHYGSLQNPVWNDYTLPAPVTFATGEQFFIVIGPAPGGQQFQGWHVLMDNGTNVGNSAWASARTGAYTNTNRNFTIRAGVAEDGGPDRAYVTLMDMNAPEWYYRLHRESGTIHRVTFTRFCEGTTGEVRGAALAAGWNVENFGDSIVFSSPVGLAVGVLDTFVLSHPTCAGHSQWFAGDSSGFIDGPLPVALAGFEAVSKEDGIELRFATASEYSNAHFEIWRGDNAQHGFRLLTRIQSRGQSQTRQEYRFLDEAVEPGRNYWYYLADVSLAGVRTEHREWMRAAARAEALVPGEFGLEAYPNPFNPVTTLVLMLPEAAETVVQIFNVEGKRFQTLTAGKLDAGRHEFDFNAADLPSGVYLAQVSAGTYHTVKKLLLVK